MANRLRRHLSFANLISVLALFIALGASAYAATQLKKNSVGPAQIRNAAVQTAKLKKGAVTSPKLADGVVTSAKLAENSVSGAKVQDGSLSGADINQSTLTGVKAANVVGLLVKGDGSCSAQVPFPSGISSEHLGLGDCLVTLPFSVANCAVTATVGGSLVIALQRSAQTYRDPKLPNQITVNTFQGESHADLPFDLVLVC